MKNIKEQICTQLHQMLDIKIEAAKQSIKATKEARNNDTKSTAGDKHETGRSMMQIELDKEEAQLNNTLNLKSEISKINFERSYKKVEFGSLVITNQGNYFISIGIGKLEMNNKEYFVISLASPIGMLLKDKQVGDKISFQQKEISIIEII